MLIARDQVQDGGKYYVTQDGWIDLGGGNKEYIGTKFMSSTTREYLSEESLTCSKTLLALFCVPVVCEVKDGSTFVKRINEQVKLNMFQLLDINDISNPINIFSPQDHKDILLGYINSLEVCFGDDCDTKKLDIVRNNLDKLYSDIEKILDDHIETDDKGDTVNKIETLLRNFLLNIPHDVHANITIDTDGSLHHVLIEARNYLDKKFNAQNTEVDDEWLEDIVESHMNPPVSSSIKNYDSAVAYLYDGIKDFYEIEGIIDGDEEDLERKVDKLYDDIQSLINSLQEGIITPDQYLDFTQKTNCIYKKFLINIYGEKDVFDKSIYHHNDFAEIDKRIGLVVMFKFPKDYFRSCDDVQGLYDQLFVCEQDDQRKSLLQSLAQYTDEQLTKLSIENLNHLLDIVLEREDYIFAARVRDIISKK